ncbi:hypothetical protein [Amycolatopsis anabasis]|uniref:hypothetical protein n=1 Tax=Amycolatopsis anabasis TaxID=1840409 RepID=UPI00131C72F0|nr:hypothetical protein [Amycolatopsis anabasis]
MTTETLAKPAVAPEIPRQTAIRRRPVPRRFLPAFAVLAGMVAIGWQASRYGNWIVDDAAITFAYARSFAEGLGPVVAAGEPPVEGFSNPTWTALLAAGRLLGLFDRGALFGIPDYVLFPKALALLCCGGLLTACHLAAARVTRRPWLVTLVTGLVLASIPSFVIWCFSGLENALFALAVVTLAVLLFRAALDNRLLTGRVALLAGALAAFAALTRPDGAIYAAAYPVVLLIHLRRATLPPSVRHALLSGIAFAVPFGGYLAWRYLEFGRLLSNPSVAKAQAMPKVEDLARTGQLVQYAGALAVLVLVVIVGMALSRSSWWRGLVALLVPLGLGLVAYSVMMPDWMAQFRFATPVWALATLIGTLATAEVLRHTRLRARILVPAALIAAVVPSGVVFDAAADGFRREPTLPMCWVADRYGSVFNTYADLLGAGRVSLLTPDLGGTALTSRLDIVDMAGLAEPKIADFIKHDDLAGLRDYVFDDVKPVFINSRGPWGPGNRISSDPRIDRDYYPVHGYSEQGFPAGDWVRKDAVATPEQLRALRDYANIAVPEIDRKLAEFPLRSCGATLRPGQTAISRVS